MYLKKLSFLSCKNLVFDTCYSSLKSFLFNDKKKSVYTYLGEEKFEKLKIIENMEIEELQKKFQEDVSIIKNNLSLL